MEDTNIWLTLIPVIVYAVANWGARIIPDSAEGLWGQVRKILKIVSLHVKDKES